MDRTRRNSIINLSIGSIALFTKSIPILFESERLPADNGENADKKNRTVKMKIKDSYSVFVTKKLSQTKDFYIKWFEFEIVFESSFFILLKAPGESNLLFGFIDEKHPSSPPDNPALDKKSGVFLTLEVEDAESVYKDLKKREANITFQLATEPWGQKRFGMLDPNELYIDIVQQIEPAKGFWDKYM